MEYRDIQKEISTGHIRHCYLFHGEEKYRIGKMVALVTEKIIGPDKNSFNYQVFYGSETSGAAITGSARTFSLFSKKKFMLIKETEKISDPENLVKLVKKTPEHCYLIFLAEKVDFRQKLFAAFRKAGADVKFWRPFENMLPGWIRQRVREEGFSISSDAVNLFVGFCGTDLMRLDSELEKVFLYLGEKKIINAGDVEKAGIGGPVYNVFELTDSIGTGNINRAIDIVDQLLVTGEHPLKIMALIVRQFRNIWQGRQMLSQGDSPGKIGQKLRVNRLSLKNFLTQTRRFDDRSLKRIFKILLDYDLRFKSSRTPPNLLMELLIIDICY
jgi:DNA polymerase-3 subunit delta